MGNILCSLLDGELDIQVVRSATTVEEALNWMSQTDVALVASNLADGGTLRLLELTAEQHRHVKSIVLGLIDSANRILPYVEAGADAYVLRDDSTDELLRVIRAAHNDKAFVSPKVASALMSRLTELARKVPSGVTAEALDELTSREIEVLQHISDGLTNQEIADRLVIEVGTVKNHVHSILQKLEVSTREEASAHLSTLDDFSPPLAD
jgi:DNA-binding NarL/FixJ family response regulator